jgi:hypothetical protein
MSDPMVDWTSFKEMASKITENGNDVSLCGISMKIISLAKLPGLHGNKGKNGKFLGSFKVWMVYSGQERGIVRQ